MVPVLSALALGAGLTFVWVAERHHPIGLRVLWSLAWALVLVPGLLA